MAEMENRVLKILLRTLIQAEKIKLTEEVILKNTIKKILLAILGLLQGTLSITGWSICISRNILGGKRLQRRYVFGAVWIYDHDRLVSHNDNCNYSASKK